MLWYLNISAISQLQPPLKTWSRLTKASPAMTLFFLFLQRGVRSTESRRDQSHWNNARRGRSRKSPPGCPPQKAPRVPRQKETFRINELLKFLWLSWNYGLNIYESWIFTNCRYHLHIRIWGYLWYFRISQVFKVVVFCRLSQYIASPVIFGFCHTYHHLPEQSKIVD